MAYTLKLTGPNVTFDGDSSLDLSAYLRLGRDDGMDTDPVALEPVFSDSPFDDGQQLVSVTANAQERVYPLYLSDTSKDALHQLVAAVNWQLAHNAPLVLEERDENATASTFRDVVFGRFDPTSDFRLQQHGWKAGTLRLWVRPYGHTATSRLVATAAGNLPILTVGPVGSLAGDAPGLLDLRVTAVSQATDGVFVAAAVLPHASYAADLPAPSLVWLDPAAASMAIGGPGVSLISDAVTYQPAPLVRADLGCASVYRGRNRVFAQARALAMPGIALRAFDQAGRPLGPTAVASTYLGIGGLVDLGVLEVPDSPGQATVSIRVDGGRLPASGYWGAYGALASNMLRLRRLIILPEDTLTVIADTRLRSLAVDGIDPAGTGVLQGAADGYGNPWGTLAASGVAMSLWRQTASYNGHYGIGSPTQTGLKLAGNQLTIAAAEPDMRIEADVYKDVATQAYAAFFKMIGASDYVAAMVGADYARLSVIASTSVVADASVSLPSSARHVVSLDTVGPIANLQVRSQSLASQAALQASHAAINRPGHPAIAAQATVATVSAIRFAGLRVTSVPSRALPSGAVHRLDGVTDSAWRATPSDAWLADVTGRSRGRMPQAPAPTTPQLAVLASLSPPAVNDDALRVEVRVRERFTYAR